MSSDANLKEQDLSLPPILSQSLSVQLNRAAQETRELFNHYLQSLNLTAKGFAVLSVLLEHPASSQMDLGKCLGIDRTTMVSVIDVLEQHHFVERTRHPNDRRQYAIVLTPAGKEVYQQALQYAQRSEEEYLAPLTQEQRQQLKALLQLLLPGGNVTSGRGTEEKRG
jgi:DNA-binding MarR family transcriptional regulator